MNFPGIFYALHVTRGLKQGFKPLTAAQYMALCSKIEGAFPFTIPGKH
jgi:hypothetical protein